MGMNRQRVPVNRASACMMVAGATAFAGIFYTGAAAAPPERGARTYLKIGDDTLRVRAGEPVRFTLDLPEGETWASANIGQLQVRTFGKAGTITPDPTVASTELTYRFAEPGYAIVILAAGPAAAKGHTDSIQRTPYCAKLLIRVDPASSDATDTAPPLKSPGLTAKVGMKVEVCPYIDPTHLVPEAAEGGADLPVRVYYEGAAQEHVEVQAIGPDGARQTETTGAKGITRFKINQRGRWLVRYTHEADGVTYTGDLIFEVEAERKGGGR